MASRAWRPRSGYEWGNRVSPRPCPSGRQAPPTGSKGITRLSRSRRARIMAPVLAPLPGWRTSLEQSGSARQIDQLPPDAYNTQRERSSPTPSPQAGAWGNLVSPYVCARPHARSAQRRDEHGGISGRAAPSLALPRWGREPGSSPQGGGWGNPVSPCPHRCWERLAPPQAGAWGNPVSPCPHRCWERLALHRQEYGETRFPHMFTSVAPFTKQRSQ